MALAEEISSESLAILKHFVPEPPPLQVNQSVPSVHPKSFEKMVDVLRSTESKINAVEGVFHSLLSAWEEGRLLPYQQFATVNFLVRFLTEGSLRKSVRRRMEEIPDLDKRVWSQYLVGK